MFNTETETLIETLEKTAAISESSSGTAQMKKKRQTVRSDNEGAGAGLGAVIGAGGGALSKKYKALATIVGGLGGALVGKHIGRKTIDTKHTSTTEGTIKKDEKKPVGAEVPRLTDQKVLKLLKSSK